MSGARKVTDIQTPNTATDIVTVVEKYLRDGGVDPHAVRQARPSDIPGEKSLLYSFNFHGGRSCKLFIYSVVEPGGARQYIWWEIGIGRIGSSTKPEIMRYMLERCRDFIGTYKLCLAEDGIIALTLRCPADALTGAYLLEALGHLDPASARLRNELAEYGICDIEQAEKDQLH